MSDFEYLDGDISTVGKLYKLKDMDNPTKVNGGLMSDAYSKVEIIGHRPIVGSQLMVGQSLASNNWLKCSPIKEILIDEEHYVKFKTATSTYEWWCTEVKD